MEKKLAEAEYIHRGEESDYEGDRYCGALCTHSKIINNDTPSAYRICTLLDFRVDCYDSCKYYMSMFEADPDLLKPFVDYARMVNCSKPKKKSLFSKVFKKSRR